MSKRDVSPKKRTKKTIKKAKLNSGFQLKKKIKITTKNGYSMLRIRKNPYTRLYYYVISMFHEKKNQTQIWNRKSLIVHHPKNTRTLELELPKNYPKMPKPLQ